MIILGILQRYAAIGFLGSLLALGAFTGGCIHGSNIERDNQLKNQEKIKSDFNVTINKLNDKYSKQDKLNSIKYEGLQNEMDKVNDDLRKCKLSHDVVRVIYKSANVSITKDTSSNVGANARVVTNYPAMTGEDLTNTLVAHDRKYFECKDKLDFFQSLPWSK